MIEIEHLSKSFEGVRVVDDVSLSVNDGEIVAVVGTSGSGKTTLLRMINRLIEPDSGRVLIDGRDTHAGPAYLLRRQIGYAIQGHGLFPHRTVGQNIGLATVASLIGGGGFGVFVFQGVGQTAMDLVLLGAVPTVAMAFAAGIVLDAAVEMVSPGGRA